MKRERWYVFFLVFFTLFVFGTVYLLAPSSETSRTTGLATSQVGNLSVGVQTYLACTWSNDALDVNFGSNLDPNNVVNASGNNASGSEGTSYNMTVSALSTSNVDLEILGENLIDSGNIISISNVTYATNTTDADGYNMVYANGVNVTGAYVNMETGVAAGDSVHFRFWLHIPAGTVAGSYAGNYTQRCTQA